MINSLIRYYRTAITSVILAILCSLLSVGYVKGQVDFEVYSDYDITTTKIQHPLDFGQVISGDVKTITLGDGGMAVLEIRGVKFMDIFVDISASTSLQNTGSSTDTFPFTLNVAYDNNVSSCPSPTYSTARAEFITLSSNNGSERFRISERTSGPPKPPPTPDHSGYNPPECSAYLFFYGEIDVGNVDAGTYETTITVNITYD